MCVLIRTGGSRSSLIIASDIFTATVRPTGRTTPLSGVVRARICRTHGDTRTHARQRVAGCTGGGGPMIARFKFDSHSLTRRVQVDGPPSSSSSSSSVAARGDEGEGWPRSETRLGETTPRLINPPSVADEGSERRQRRQRNNAHSTTGRTHRARTHLAAGTCDPHALFTGKPEALEDSRERASERARARAPNRPRRRFIYGGYIYSDDFTTD